MSYSMKLKEGSTYLFTTGKIIDLPGGGSNLIVTGPDSKKYLLPLMYYNSYDLVSQTAIRCRVDKINCSGKVFLEPEHPFYLENETYPFTVVSYRIAGDSSGADTEIATVTDNYGIQHDAPASLLKDRPGTGESVMLKINRITKGRFLFTAKHDEDTAGDLVENQIYDFRIDRIAGGAGEDDFFIVIDPFGKEHRLKVRYYSHYGLEPGKVFRGRVIRYGNGRRKTIEPENPWFNVNDEIELTITGYKALPGDEGYLAEGFDRHGFTHTMTLENVPHSTQLICRVVKIKKGRPVLSAD